MFYTSFTPFQNTSVIFSNIFLFNTTCSAVALIPCDIQVGKVADYLHRALTMPTPEAEVESDLLISNLKHSRKQVRMTALRTREKADDLDHWMKSFFREIDSDLGNEVFNLPESFFSAELK